MSWWKILKSAWRLPDVRVKILTTLGLLVLVRVVSFIPLPVVDRSLLNQVFNSNQLFGLIDIFSGGALAQFSIGFLGVGPYITSSIIMQLMTHVIPALEQMQKEGEQERSKLNQYTRLLSLPLAIVQAWGLLALIRNSGGIGQLNPAQLATVLIVASAGSVLLMWLGELISESGIGNGISIIITFGILSQVPAQIVQTIQLVVSGGLIEPARLVQIGTFLVVAAITVVAIVFFQDAERKVPITYARGARPTSSPESYLPLKMIIAGVMPIIFAISIMIFPGLAGQLMAGSSQALVVRFGQAISRVFNPAGLTYSLIYFALVVGFTFFYTSIIVRPKDMAESLQRQGAFIPGIRPGRETMNYLNLLISRITLPGALFLGLVAILPTLFLGLTRNPNLLIQGTGALIAVVVSLETARSLKALVLTRSYDQAQGLAKLSKRF